MKFGVKSIVFRFLDKIRATALLAGCPISLALMGYAVKLSEMQSMAEVLLARFGISAIVYVSFLWVIGFDFSAINPKKHIVRTILGFSSVAFLFASITRIPLSTAICLSYTVPMFSYIVSVALHQVKISYRIIYVASSLMGVLLIVNPSANIDLIGCTFALSSAFMGALALFEIKKISLSEGKEAVLVMYFIYSTIALTIYLFIFGETQFDGTEISEIYILSAVGIFGLFYQVTLVASLSLSSVTTVSLTLLAAIAIGYGIDVILLDANISALALLGSLILAVSLALYSISERKVRVSRK